jgi:hypothetical protein
MEPVTTQIDVTSEESLIGEEEYGVGDAALLGPGEDVAYEDTMNVESEGVDLVGPGEDDVELGSGNEDQGFGTGDLVGPGEEGSGVDGDVPVSPEVQDRYPGYDIFQFLEYFGEVCNRYFVFIKKKKL